MTPPDRDTDLVMLRTLAVSVTIVLLVRTAIDFWFLWLVAR